MSKTPRSGFYFLGSGEQSVAEHTNRVVFIGYVLSMMSTDSDLDIPKALKMCLFHDLAEARTSDLNYVHQKYAKADESKALSDLAATLPFGPDIQEIVNERNAGKTKEARIAKDADQLEWLMSLKEQYDRGTTKAEGWFPATVKRLKTENAQLLAKRIIETDSDHWWFHDKEDSWWVNKNKTE